MSILAIVHSPAELDRACEGMSAFLSFHYRTGPAARTDPLIGIWLEPAMAAAGAAGTNEGIPAAAGRIGVVRESVSVGGVWTLCWLISGQLGRLPLLNMLLEGLPTDSENGLAGRFIPVYLEDLPASEMQSETHQLRRHRPSRVMPSLWQEGTTGRIVLPHDYARAAIYSYN